jgi:hypothetical protein
MTSQPITPLRHMWGVGVGRNPFVPKWTDTFLTVNVGQRLRLDARVVPPLAVKAAAKAGARNSPHAPAEFSENSLAGLLKHS